MVVIAESHNILLACSFANTLWPEYSDYVSSRAGSDAGTLRQNPETAEIHESLIRLTADLPVLKVKIYDLGGLTVYSSEQRQIGESKADNIAFLASALDGISKGNLSHRDTFASFQGPVTDRYLFESYVAVRGANGDIEEVFELYSDVTQLVDRIDEVTLLILASLLVVFGVLYAVLSRIVSRADKILKRQYAELICDKETIQSQISALEHENRERKSAEKFLRLARDQLEIRVVKRTAELEREVQERQRAEVELRIAKEQAEFANRNKTEFLANMSHELRTPFNAIIGFPDMILGKHFGPVGDTKYLEYAEDINVSGAHILEVINENIDISKVEAGRTDLSEEVIDVAVVLTSSIWLIRARAQEGNINISCKPSLDLPGLFADERKLKQMLINVLANAVKFTSPAGKVTISAWASPEDGYRLRIADTGIGIAPEDIPKVMESFGQVDGGLNRKYDGTGLGLPLTKALVELHGGSLELLSELGVGFTVTICFPASRIDTERDRAA